MSEYWPQIVVIAWMTLFFVVSTLDQGKLRKTSMWRAVTHIIIWIALLYWGGFWK
jgi:hypothetical protein